MKPAPFLPAVKQGIEHKKRWQTRFLGESAALFLYIQEEKMEYLIGIITNKLFVAAAASWFMAQGSKMIIEVMKGGFRLERLAGGGGMPSAHSATVTGLTTATAIVYGTGGFEFVMALFFSIIVIYDAMGVRYETGQEAKVLNRMRRRDRKEGREEVQERDLDEKMGHTPPEILCGILVGLIGGILVCWLMRGI